MPFRKAFRHAEFVIDGFARLGGRGMNPAEPIGLLSSPREPGRDRRP